jgi:hypothetical protein
MPNWITLPTFILPKSFTITLDISNPIEEAAQSEERRTRREARKRLQELRLKALGIK